MKNIKEEIDRIKKLFTEERLYGNLINEQPYATDTNNDGNIDEPEAREFLNSLDYYVTKKSTLEPSKTTGEACFQQKKMKVIQDFIIDSISLSTMNNLEPKFSSDSGICYLRLMSDSHDTENGYISKLIMWIDGVITFYYRLPKAVDFTSVDTLTGGTMPNISTGNPLVTTISTFGKMMTTRDISFIRLQCNYKPTELAINPVYSDLTFAGFYDKNYKRTAKPVERQIIKNWYYNCCDGSGNPATKSDVGINQMLLGSEYLNVLSSDKIKVLLDKIG